MNRGSGDPIAREDLSFSPDEGFAFYKGERIRLTPYPLKVLTCIHEQHPSPVGNKELLLKVWSSSAVDVNLPQQHISKMNKELPKYGLYVHSEPEVGYHIALVEELVRPGVLPPTSEAQRVVGMLEDLGDDVAHERKILAYSTWKPSTIKLSQAERSITIIDSYFSEYWELGLCIMNAMKRKMGDAPSGSGAEKLKLDVYMISPDTNFGAQRLKEMDRPEMDDATCRADLQKGISAAERDRYRHEFDGCVNGLTMISKEHPVELRIHEYFAMPSTRIIAIDDKHFFFGWFPLWAYNPGYVCLYLEDGDLNGADQEMIRRLRQQINNIAAISRLRISSPPTGRKKKKR